MPDETLRGPDTPPRPRDPRAVSSRPGDRARSGDRVRHGGRPAAGTARSGEPAPGRARSAPAARPRRVPARHFGRLMLLAMALVIVVGFVAGMLLPVS